MSAPNFYAASGKYFIINGDDEGAIEDVKSSMVAHLQADIDHLVVSEEDEWDRDRNYGGKIFATITPRPCLNSIYAELRLIVRGGYFSGANLDYEARVYNSYTGERLELNEVDVETFTEVREAYDGQKLSRARAESGIRTLARDLERLEAIVSAAAESYTTTYKRVGMFSNGEAVYELSK